MINTLLYYLHATILMVMFYNPGILKNKVRGYGICCYTIAMSKSDTWYKKKHHCLYNCMDFYNEAVFY